jgi:hypothetical protein
LAASVMLSITCSLDRLKSQAGPVMPVVAAICTPSGW